MADMQIGAAPGGNANQSRRAGLRSSQLRLKGRESWRRLFRRGRRDPQSAEGFIGLGGRLARLGKCIGETYDRIAEAPAYAGDAPARMIADLQSWIETGTKLALLGNRFDQSFVELIEYAQSGNAPLDMSELLKRRVHPVPVLARHPAPKVLSLENDRIFRIHIRRQRPSRLAVAEAPKRVSRGRAPPPVSICSL